MAMPSKVLGLLVAFLISSTASATVCRQAVGEFGGLAALHVKYDDKKAFAEEIFSDSYAERVVEKYFLTLDPYRMIFFDTEFKVANGYKMAITEMVGGLREDCLFFEATYEMFANALRRHKAIMKNTFRDEKQLAADVQAILKKWKSEEGLADEIELMERFADSPEELAEKAKLILAKEVNRVAQGKEMTESDLRTGLRIISQFRNGYDFHKPESLYQAMAKSMLDALDAHTRYFTKTKYDAFMDALTAGFAGIGVHIVEAEQGLKVVEVVSGGPADQQGVLKAGDVIISANGDEEVLLEPVETAVLALKGDPGTAVSVDIMRDGQRINGLEIVRGFVNTQKESVTYRVEEIDGVKYGYVHATQFYSASDMGEGGLSASVKKALISLEDQGVEGLLLDLSGNPGGSVDEAVRIVGLFIDEGPVVRLKGPVVDDVKVDTDSSYKFNKPVVVMIDHGSASASEIVSGALQDYNRALVIGADNSYGKGSGQSVFATEAFSGLQVLDGGVKLTTFYYYLPTGRSIQHRGVQSDVVLPAVTSSEEEKLEKDVNPTSLPPKPIDSLMSRNGGDKWMSDTKRKGYVSDLNEGVSFGYYDSAEKQAFQVLKGWVRLSQGKAALTPLESYESLMMKVD